MIELQNVGFAYNNKHTVFSNLNLYIDRGDIVSIVGNSGCGKTTLLNLIAGVLLPSKGEIKKSDKNIAYLMQDVTLLPYRTAWENTFLACELRGIPVDNIQKQAAKEILDLFNIETGSSKQVPQRTLRRNETTDRIVTNSTHRRFIISA